MHERSDKPVALVPSSQADSLGTVSLSERRGGIRYPFIATAEVTDLKSGACVAGRSSDLGLGGCYVDTISPLPEGTSVRVRLNQSARQFEATATVSYEHPLLGMGLVFIRIDTKSAEVLQMWIAELSGERMPESNPEPVTATTEGISSSDTREAMSELIKLLVRRKLIQEYEGAALLNQISR